MFIYCIASAGKFPTPISPSEDLGNKLVEVRSTIKFQLKKVLCLGVAVGHVQMTDDQVLANVMLSPLFAVLPLSMLTYCMIIFRHQFPCLIAQKELAEH